MADNLLQWHDGFHASLQIELRGEAAQLEFYSEHELYKKALRVDTLVIKNSDDTPVQKKIGKIFRKYNLIEYKSPGDYLNINDFYKVYGYACLYQSNTEKTHEIAMKDVTITFVCSHYPRKMLKILKEERKIEAEQIENGIYRLKNDSIAMQILVTWQLSAEENRWLTSLTRNLPMNENTKMLLREYQRNKGSILYQSAMDLIMQANKGIMEEDGSMVCDVLKEIFADEWKEKELQMQEKESQIQQKESWMREKASEIEEGKHWLQQKENQMQQKENQMQQKESQMQQKESQMQQKESQMQQKESWMREKASEIEEGKNWLQQKESQMRQKESQMQERESWLQEQEILLLQKEADSKKRIEKREKRLHSLIQLLLHENLMDDLKRVSEDRGYLEQMYQRYGL